MGDLTPGEIFAILCGLLLAAAGAINTVGSAVEKIAKARKAAQAPNEEQNRQLRELQEWRMEMEKWREEVGRKLTSDKAELSEIKDGLQAIFQGQLALLDHGLDGNNVEQMQNAKTVLQHHLITHK